MLGNTNRWTSQVKPGQPVTCRIAAKVEGGYNVSFGSNLTGFLPVSTDLKIGSELVLQFVGYKGRQAVFNAAFGLGPRIA